MAIRGFIISVTEAKSTLEVKIRYTCPVCGTSHIGYMYVDSDAEYSYSPYTAEFLCDSCGEDFEVLITFND